MGGYLVEEFPRMDDHGQAKEWIGGGVDLERGEASRHVGGKERHLSVSCGGYGLPVVRAGTAEVKHVHGQPCGKSGRLTDCRREGGRLWAFSLVMHAYGEFKVSINPAHQVA